MRSAIVCGLEKARCSPTGHSDRISVSLCAVPEFVKTPRGQAMNMIRSMLTVSSCDPWEA